jgi:L-ascorbate metabolism protein UlaG (beta-lactamase superfamily)
MKILNIIALVVGLHILSNAQPVPDTLQTNEGTLKLYFVGHASLYFNWNGKIIHVDPFSRMGDYSLFPKADLILLTHHHPDHLDTNALRKIEKEDTHYIMAPICDGRARFAGTTELIANGEQTSFEDLKIEAVPAYNIVHKRDNGNPYHPKGEGNGYIVQFGKLRVYIAGDTENIPEMVDFGPIDVAYLPMNLPFTMTPEMVVDAVNMLQPRILYPYHYGQTRLESLTTLMQNNTTTEVRLR